MSSVEGPNPRTTQVEIASAIWLEVQKQAIVSAPSRVADGGKQIITLSTVLAGAYFTAVAFSSLGTIGNWALRAVHVLPILFWSAALVCAIPTVVPVRESPTSLGDPLSGKNVFVDTVHGNLVWLRLGLGLLLAGILAMLAVLWLRLSGLTAATETPMLL